MIREIITIAISVLSATGILGIGTRSILNRMQKQDARQKLWNTVCKPCSVTGCCTAITSTLMQGLHPSTQRKTTRICIGSIMNWAATV